MSISRKHSKRIAKSIQSGSKAVEPSNVDSSLPPPGTTAAAMALLASRLVTVGKVKPKRTPDKKIDTSLSTIGENIKSNYWVESDKRLIFSNKHNQPEKNVANDSKANTSVRSNKTHSTASTCVATPVEINYDAKIDELKAILPQPNFEIQENIETTQIMIPSPEKYKELANDLENPKLEYKQMLLEQKKKFENIIQELKNTLEKTKKDSELVLKNARKEFEERIIREKSEIIAQKDELVDIHNSHKMRLIKEINVLKTAKEQAENNLLISSHSIFEEKHALTEGYEQEIEKIRNEHMRQLEEICKGNQNGTLTEIRLQQDRRQKDFEMRLRSQIKELMTELKEKENAEVSWIQYKRESEYMFAEFRSQLEMMSAIVEEKEDIEAKLSNLEQEFSRSQQEVKTLMRVRDNTNKMIAMFQQKTEEVIKDLKQKLDTKCNEADELHTTIKTLREQAKNPNEELFNIRGHTSNVDLEHHETKPKDLQRSVSKKQKRSTSEGQLTNLKQESEKPELNNKKDTQSFIEPQEKVQEHSLIFYRKKLESSPKKEQSDQEQEYEEIIKYLTTQNDDLTYKFNENLKVIQEMRETTRRLEGIESSYKELNSKKQKSDGEKQQLLVEITSILSENNELNNNNDIIRSEKERALNELSKANEEIQQLKEQNLVLDQKIKTLESERDKLASVISDMKEKWQKNLQDTQETNAQRDQLNIELSDIKSEYSSKVKEVETLVNNIADLKEQNESLSKLLDEQQTEMQAIVKETHEKTAWQQKNADLLKMHELELKERDEKLRKLYDELEGEKHQSEGLKEQLKLVTRNLSDTKQQKESLEEFQTEMQTKMNESDTERETWKKKETDILSQCESKLKEKDEKLQELREMFVTESQVAESNQQKLVKTLEDKDKEIQLLEALKKQSLAHIKDLEVSMNHLTDKLRETESDAEQIKRQADAQIEDIQNRLDKSMNEIEELQNQVNNLKQLSENADGCVKETEELRTKLSDMTLQSHEKYERYDNEIKELQNEVINLTKMLHEKEQLLSNPRDSSSIQNVDIEGHVSSINNEIYEANQERNELMSNPNDHVECKVNDIQNRINDMLKTFAEEKEGLIQIHQSTIASLKKHQDEEIMQLTEIMKSRLEALEKKQRVLKDTAENHRLSNRRSSADTRRMMFLEQRSSELENELFSSKAECDRLNMKIMEFQKFVEEHTAANDNLIQEKNNLESKLKSLEDKLQDVLNKNMNLIMQLSINH